MTDQRHQAVRVLVAGVVVVSSLTLSGGSASAGSRTADRPRTGYELRHDGTAAGDWIGSRAVRRTVAYRIDPGRAPVTSGFKRDQWVRQLAGSGPIEVSRMRTRRAAWLVSKYGTFPSADQSAAVELALNALLHGGAYALNGVKSRGRLRQTGGADGIVPLVQYMLEKSRLYAGPYRVRLTGDSAVIGDRLRIAATVTSIRGGEPIRSLPVTIKVFGDTIRRTTDDSGTVRARPKATEAGPHPVKVTVHKLPAHELRVRRPRGGHGSRVVLAGRKLTVTRTTSVAVQARPSAGVSAPDERTTDGAVPGTVHLWRSYPGSRAAQVTLYGPFASKAAASCAPTAPVMGTGQIEVADNGPYAVPALTATTPGYYRWGASVAGDRFNLSAAACGQTILLRGVPRLTVASTKSAVRVRGSVAAEVSVRDLPDWYANEVVVRIYGPFTSRDRVRCLETKRITRRKMAVTGPSDRATTTSVTLRKRGFYGWEAVLPASRLSARVVEGCGSAGTTVRAGPAG